MCLLSLYCLCVDRLVFVFVLYIYMLLCVLVLLVCVLVLFGLLAAFDVYCSNVFLCCVVWFALLLYNASCFTFLYVLGLIVVCVCVLLFVFACIAFVCRLF